MNQSRTRDPSEPEPSPKAARDAASDAEKTIQPDAWRLPKASMSRHTGQRRPSTPNSGGASSARSASAAATAAELSIAPITRIGSFTLKINSG